MKTSNVRSFTLFTSLRHNKARVGKQRFDIQSFKEFKSFVLGPFTCQTFRESASAQSSTLVGSSRGQTQKGRESIQQGSLGSSNVLFQVVRTGDIHNDHDSSVCQALLCILDEFLGFWCTLVALVATFGLETPPDEESSSNESTRPP